MRQDLFMAYAAIIAVNAITLVMPLPVMLQMLIVTVATIYIGCYNGVPNSQDSENSDKKEGNTIQQQEKMQRKDVYMFPIIGSVVLFSLYLAYKFVPTIVLTVLVKIYFLLIGVFCLGQRFAQLASVFQKRNNGGKEVVEPALYTLTFFPLVSKIYDVLPPIVANYLFSDDNNTKDNKDSNKDKKDKPVATAGGKVPLNPDDFKMDLTQTQATSLAAAGLVGVWYILTGHWLSSNLFGIAFSIQGIELIHLGSILNGVILLSALFFYDIFWVFGTDVMVTVAKNFDAPIKLLFPRASSPQPAMLGLGDIVIPGIFIAMMLRFDYAQAKAKPAAKAASPASSDYVAKIKSLINLSPYYHTCMISYAFGLIATLVVMYTFEAAQPALLYLVPACVGSVTVRAYLERKWSDFINYEEVDDEPNKPNASS